MSVVGRGWLVSSSPLVSVITVRRDFSSRYFHFYLPSFLSSFVALRRRHDFNRRISGTEVLFTTVIEN